VCLAVLRSGKGKTTKNSNEAEYRLIFDNLIDDLLAVLFWPEWPAASLILSIASKFMVAFLVLFLFCVHILILCCSGFIIGRYQDQLTNG
jgi:hypothetical protein